MFASKSYPFCIFKTAFLSAWIGTAIILSPTIDQSLNLISMILSTVVSGLIYGMIMPFWFLLLACVSVALPVTAIFQASKINQKWLIFLTGVTVAVWAAVIYSDYFFGNNVREIHGVSVVKISMVVYGVLSSFLWCVFLPKENGQIAE